VIPTESALHLFNRAKNLQECWNEIQSSFDLLETELKGIFTLGCHTSVAAYMLPPLFKRLEREAPQIKLQLVHDLSRKITEMVVSYEIDLGFVINPPKHPDLVLKKLGEDRVTFWKKRGESKVPERIFADLNLLQVKVLIDKTSKKYFKEYDLIPTTSLELIRTLTSQGSGIGILPERVTKADQNRLEIYNHNLPGHPDEIYLAYRKELMASKAGAEIIRLSTLTFT